jgi:LysR family transcriptional regulator, regulator for genes of the gallate degradation pathway
MLAGSVVLAQVLNEFVTLYPSANVRVLNGNAEDMIRYLQAGDVDFVIGLLRRPVPDGLVDESFADTPYVVAARHGHPLTRKPKVTLNDLTQYDWVVGTPGANRRVGFEKLFAGRPSPTARIATCSLPTIRLLLTESDRLTLLTSYELIFEEDALTAVPFEPVMPVPAIGLTMRENWLPTQIQASFLELIQRRIVGSLIVDKEIKLAS